MPLSIHEKGGEGEWETCEILYGGDRGSLYLLLPVPNPYLVWLLHLNVCFFGKIVGLRNFWTHLKISELFVMSLRVSILCASEFFFESQILNSIKSQSRSFKQRLRKSWILPSVTPVIYSKYYTNANFFFYFSCWFLPPWKTHFLPFHNLLPLPTHTDTVTGTAYKSIVINCEVIDHQISVLISGFPLGWKLVHCRVSNPSI